MKLQRNQKTQRVGWSLHVKRSADVGYDRVGGTFPTRDTAHAYQAKHHTRAVAYTIQGLRWDIRPITGRAKE